MNDSNPEQPKQSWWRRLSSGLKRTSSSIGSAVADLVIRRKLDRAMAFLIIAARAAGNVLALVSLRFRDS